jgi:predicted TIM-barrel fold metal-dependent hydrolase
MYRADGPAELAPVGETEFVNGVAAMSASGNYGPARICAGIVGFADLRLGAKVDSVLEAHLQAGGGRFRGIRQGSVWHPDERIRSTPVLPPRGLLADPAFRAGFARLAPHGLSFDSWLYFTQIGELTDLARAFPDTTVILDHFGGVLGVGPYAGKRDEVFAEWRQSLAGLAACPNAFVKLGGLAMRICGFGFHERALPPSSTELAAAWTPYVETAIELFGVKRCMFESNFPVDKGSCSYAILWNAFKRIAENASAQEKAALFGGTARQVYRLPEA